MAARLSVLPRFIAVVLIVLPATATLTFAAEKGPVAAPAREPTKAPAKRPVLVVPDVRDEVYVFAKSTLEEAGFAWKVVGGVPGYPANRVAAQSPAAGTRVVDTGAPTISLSLSRNLAYEQKGEPENASRFPGTALVLADAAGNAIVVPRTTHRVPAKKHATTRKPKAKHKRPPAFTVPGGRSEPQRELPLPVRARLLGLWLSTHREPTKANVRHWFYQHAWVVTGARLGWWHGAEALETLIRVDGRVRALWGMGARSEAAARAALAEVRAKSR